MVGALVVLILLVMTRTRTYITMVFGFLLIVFATRTATRAFLTFLALVSSVVAYPEALKTVGEITRLSSFITGVDPISGSTDVTNARGELSSRLIDMFYSAPSTGVGASEVRRSISSLAASSEAGLLLTFASYGILALTLLLFAVLALVVSIRKMTVRRDDRTLYCLAIVTAPFSTVLFFGTSTGFSDWLALVTLATAINTRPVSNKERHPKRLFELNRASRGR